ncbi:MAG: agmatine deiminase family protein, partial [Prevotellaceae bacterium]|nr:agmatine deiminase family protein [Prevotellaceae bacterium]
KASITDGVEVFKSNGIAGHLCKSDIIADGGNIIRLGYTTIMTSKVLEENYFRLPLSLLDELSRSLSSDIVLLPWDASEIYGHSDGIVRIVDSSTVIMTNYSQFDKQMAARFKKCLKVRFKNVRELTFLADKPYKNNWAYINWLETEKVLILPKFNVCEDEQALRQIEKFFPSYKGRIEMVDATDLIRYEGCLNCASWVINETVIQEDAWLLTQY